jgi:hypothetical protein
LTGNFTWRASTININLIIFGSIFTAFKLKRVIPVKVVYVIWLSEVFKYLIFSRTLIDNTHTNHSKSTSSWSSLLLPRIRIIAILDIFIFTAPGRILRYIDRCRYHDTLSRLDLPSSFIRDCAHPGRRGIRPLFDILYRLFLDGFLSPLMIVYCKVVFFICLLHAILQISLVFLDIPNGVSFVYAYSANSGLLDLL